LVSKLKKVVSGVDRGGKKIKPAEVSRGFYNDIRRIITGARGFAYRSVDYAMVQGYWQIGERIVQEEQKGKARAEYGSYLIKSLSERLSREFGRGFTEQNLRNFRQFYLCFSAEGEIRYALRSELSWSHYRLLMRVESSRARDFYLREAAESGWSSRALERQIHSLYYERLRSSKERGRVRKESALKAEMSKSGTRDFVKDPDVLEFLDLNPERAWLEKDLEKALIDHLQKFLLELGRGFSFVSRQQKISTETREFYIDLVFYNYLLKCFILIDLKVGELSHQDIGQMDMYVRLYEDKIRSKDDGPTIGIILCAEKDETIVKYSVLKNSRKLFASKYLLYLPTERELIEEMEREKEALKALAKENQ